MPFGAIAGLFGALESGNATRRASELAQQSVKDTNALNYKIWGEQQQHNIDMFNMQNQANIDMWNMQNEYNDPSAQIQRLSAAGLNPYLALGNNPSGVATNAPASGSVNPSTPPTMQSTPVEAFDTGINKAVDRVLQSIQLKSQLANDSSLRDLQGIQGSDIVATQPYRINQLDAVTRMNDSQRSLFDTQAWNNRLDSMYRQITMGDQIQNLRQTNAVLGAQTAILGLQKEHQEILNSALGTEKLLSIAQQIYAIWGMDLDFKHKDALIRYVRSNIDVNNSVIRKNDADTTRSYFDSGLIQSQTQSVDEDVRSKRNSNQLFEEGMDDLSKSLRRQRELDALLYENDFQFQKDIKDFSNSFIGREIMRYANVQGKILERAAGGVLSGSGSLNSSSSRSNSFSRSYGESHSVVDSYVRHIK